MKKILIVIILIIAGFTANAQVPTPNLANGSTYCVGTTKVYGDSPLNPANTYSMTVSPSEVITPISGGTQFQITWNSPGTYTLTLTETTSSGCTSTYTSTVVVNSTGVANLTSYTVCENSASFALGGTNLGTNPVWSGTGVVGGNTFDPTGLSPGVYNLTFTSLTASGCPITGTATVTITPLPTGVINSD